MDDAHLRRFMAKVDHDPINGCWLWTAAKLKNGYGIFNFQKTRLAHRLSYEHHKGDIPDGLVLDHLCRTRHCVNPAHLEAVTQWTNNYRGETLSAANVDKTHCPKGHEYAGDNLYIVPTTGGRACRECRREAGRRWYAKVGAEYYRGIPSRQKEV